MIDKKGKPVGYFVINYPCKIIKDKFILNYYLCKKNSNKFPDHGSVNH